MAAYKKRFGDRYDGRLLRSPDPFFKIIPYIMPTRMDAQNFFNDRVDIGHLEKYIREKRNSGDEAIGFLHVLIAAMVRTISQKPGLNRFIAGQKIYSRNEILISLALKKELHENSPETTIKLKFQPTDTITDVVKRINETISENKKLESKNNADKTAQLFMLCPGLILKSLVWFLKTLDYMGIMPKVINKVSPFHTSVFITDLGSLGIKPIYHHLYNFGTTTIFIAFGTKYKERIIDKSSNIIERKFVDLNIVTDERTTDGHYYASAFKLFKSFISHPEKLELPPDEIIEDIE